MHNRNSRFINQWYNSCHTFVLQLKNQLASLIQSYHASWMICHLPISYTSLWQYALLYYRQCAKLQLYTFCYREYDMLTAGNYVWQKVQINKLIYQVDGKHPTTVTTCNGHEFRPLQ